MKFIDPHQDRWHLAAGEDGPLPHPSPADQLLLTLEQWHAVRSHWSAQATAGKRLGLQLDNDADVEALKPDLPRLALIALAFPKWTDGRAYTQARLLRARLGFQGEIRATGEVLVDMLPLLQRTGFDAVQLRADQRLDSAQRALRFFAAHYQGDVKEARPIFRRLADAANTEAANSTSVATAATEAA
jgi:uncharacterized protein (DUF934 family)